MFNKICNISIILMACLVCQTALAADMAGKTMLVVGDVNAANNQSQATRKLKRRAPIYATDIVSTGGKAKTQLRMSDGGLIALKANSELVIADYNYSEDDGTGTVVMELVKGGLRSVTGNIKAQNGAYQLKTPVGSIGIRGTHYEIELANDEMFIAVWDGAIDVTVNVGVEAGTQLSFGEGEDYSYASIGSSGKVTKMLAPPKSFNSGMTEQGSGEVDDADNAEEESTESEESGSKEQVASEETDGADSSAQETDDQSNSSQTEVASNNESPNTGSNNSPAPDLPADESDFSGIDSSGATQYDALAGGLDDTSSTTPGDDYKDTFSVVPAASTEQLLQDRSGKLTYSSVESFNGSSSAGDVSNFQMSMAIDFDSLGVTAGNLTLDDAEGEWRATFSGNISNSGEFFLDVSHASHGDNLADGEIEAIFFDGLDSILGAFTLEEILRPNINTHGDFIIK